MPYSFYGEKNISSWMHDQKRKKLKTVPDLYAIHYISELRKLQKQLARTAVINYFLLTRLGMTDCRSMTISAASQRKFCFAAIAELNTYELDPKYHRPFDKNLEKIQRRIDHIYRITQENLRLTRYWPYFEAVGFDRLLNFPPVVYNENGGSMLDIIMPELEQWMAEHEEEVDKHMEKVQPEIDRIKAFREKKAAEIKANKEAEKAEKKRLKEEQKQRLKERNAEIIRQNKIDREISESMRRAGILPAKKEA